MPSQLVPEQSTSDVLADFFRCPPQFVALPPTRAGLAAPGYFRVGEKAVGYGATAVPCPSAPGGPLPDLLGELTAGKDLPFDPIEVIRNLQMERYPLGGDSALSSVLSSEWLKKIYYRLRPLMPDPVRNLLQRRYFRGWEKLPFPAWPVDTSVETIREGLMVSAMRHDKVDRVPFLWFWPNGASAAAIMTHDVETDFGRDFIPDLISIDQEFGISASYQIVPEERYPLTPGLLSLIREQGCEVNVHDLTHDGALFRDEENFRESASKINSYLDAFDAQGFRAACMYRNQEWFSELNAKYDMSVPNVAHLEPQRGGCCTVFPYFVGDVIELPLTMTQDFSLFSMLQTYSMDLWDQQMAIIQEKHGLMSFISHPDYLQEPRAMAAYRELLGRFAQFRDTKGVWVGTPGEVAQWWRDREASCVVQHGSDFVIEGPARGRGSIAYATLEGGQVRYHFS